MSDMCFKTLYVIGDWEDDEDCDNQKISLFILLMTDQDKNSDIEICVSYDGMFFEYSIHGPILFTDHLALHKNIIESGTKSTADISKYHLIAQAIKSFFVRQKGSSTYITSLARIHLPFRVESRFDHYSRKVEHISARVLHIVLAVPVRKNSSTNSNTDEIQFG